MEENIITLLDPELLALAKQVADEYTPPTEEDIKNLAADLAKFTD